MPEAVGLNGASVDVAGLRIARSGAACSAHDGSQKQRS